MPDITRVSRALALMVAVPALAACSGDGSSARSDSAGTTAAAPVNASTDTGMAGMDHANMPGMNRPPARDADQECLRMMSDHHEGLIRMASAAMTKGSNASVQADAHRLHTKQQDEQKQMIGMLQASYQETLTPMVMGSNMAMNDSLQARSGADYDKAFYGNVVRHHQEGIRMIDEFLPRLKNPELRQMAEKMKVDQQKEIQEFQGKASA